MSETDKTPDVPPAPTFTYGEPAPPAPAAPQPAPPQQPRYGEYAPPGYVPPGYVPPAAIAPVEPAGRRRRTWDVVLTSVLLVVGLFGMGLGLLYAAALGDPALLDATFESLGLDGFAGDVGAAPVILGASHVVLYVAAVAIAIPLLVSKRIAFWAPLAAGVIAAIIFWATWLSVIMSDPNLSRLGGM